MTDDKYTLYGQVIASAEQRFDVTYEQLTWKRRIPHLVLARQWIWMVLHDTHGWSFPEIARTMDFKNHTTILHGVRKARKRWLTTNTAPKAATPGQWSTCATSSHEAFTNASPKEAHDPNRYEAERATEALAI